MKNIIIIALVIVVIGAGIFFYSKQKSANYQSPVPSSNSSTTTTTQPSTMMQQATSPAAMTTSQKITIEGDEFKFMPATMNLKKGEPAEITFKNTGKYPHNLTIPELNVKTKTIQAGEQDTVQFTPDKTGQFTYFCSVDSHEEKGMKGTLTVQ